MITKKKLEILNYIFENGGISVIATPRLVKQNEDMYNRIWRLEHIGAIECVRRPGLPTLYTITPYGCEIVRENRPLD